MQQKLGLRIFILLTIGLNWVVFGVMQIALFTFALFVLIVRIVGFPGTMVLSTLLVVLWLR